MSTRFKSNRRSLLKYVGAAGLTGLAGCGGQTGDGDGDGTDGDGTGDGTGGDGDGIPREVDHTNEHLVEPRKSQFDPDQKAYRLIAREGERIGPIPISYNTGRATWQRDLALATIDAGRAIGFEMELVSQTFNQYLTSKDWGFDYPYRHSLYGPEPLRMADPIGMMARVMPNHRNNHPAWAHPEAADLIRQSNQAVDQQERYEIVKDVYSITNERHRTPMVGHFPIGAVANTRDWEGWVETRGMLWTNNIVPWNEINVQPLGDRTAFVRGILEGAGFETTNPLYVAGGLEETVLHSYIYSGLQYMDPDLELVPGLATSLEFIDETTVEAELRNGVTWHDGEDFDVGDVAFTAEYQIEHEPPEQAFFWEPLVADNPTEIVSESGGGTIRFNLSRPVSHWLTTGGYWGMMVPRHIWEDIDDPVDHVPDPPIGTGPFRWVSWDQGSRTELERWDDCWLWDDSYKREVLGDQYVSGSGPDRMIYAVVGSVDTLVGALQSGDIDTVAPNFTIQNARQAAEGADHLEWDSTPTITPTIAWADRTNPLQRDMEYRVAFEGYALNYEDVVEQVWEGEGMVNPASIEVHPSQPWYPDDPIEWGHMQDFDRAREILAQAGYTWDDQDRIHFPEGDAWDAFYERVQPENMNTRREELGQPDFS